MSDAAEIPAEELHRRALASVEGMNEPFVEGDISLPELVHKFKTLEAQIGDALLSQQKLNRQMLFNIEIIIAVLQELKNGSKTEIDSDSRADVAGE